MQKVIAILVAAGAGTRFSSATPKQFLPLLGKPLLAHTIDRFRASGVVDDIVLVLPRADFDQAKRIMSPFLSGFSSARLVPGGDSRQASVREGLMTVATEFDGLVAVHDGARPSVPPSLIVRVVEMARAEGAAIAAVPVVETLKKVSAALVVERTVERESFYRAQTPQCFRCEVLKRALDRARADGFEGTDEAALVERLGIPVRIVLGSEENLKVTTAEDFARAEYYLRKGEET